MAARLVLGDPDLGLDLTDPDGPFEVSAADAGTDLSNPVPVTETVPTALQDGTFLRWLRDDNRVVKLLFEAKGEGLNDIAKAVEESLVLPFMNGGITLLTSYPDDEDADADVYEVWTVWSEEKTDDFGTVAVERRRSFTLTLTAQPYVRSKDLVVDSALPGYGGSLDTIDDGSSVASWTTIAPSGSISAIGGSLSFPAFGYANLVTIQGQRDIASRNFTTRPYVCVDVNVPAGSHPTQANFRVDTASTVGAVMEPVAVMPSPDNAGWTRFWFQIPSPPTAGTKIYFLFTFSLPTTTLPTSIRIDNVKCQGVAPVLSVATSTIRTINVQGSQRTPGNLRVQNAEIVYTAPDISYWSYNPLLYMAASENGGSVFGANPATVSAAKLPPGSHVFVVRGTFKTTNGAQNTVAYVTATITITQGGETQTVSRVLKMTRTLGSGPSSYYGQYDGTLVIGSYLMPLGGVVPSSTVTCTIAASISGASTVKCLWTFWKDEEAGCALTIPKDSLLGTNKYLWIDSPVVGKPYPAVYVGTAADKSDAINMHTKMETWDDHTWKPGLLTVYISGGQADLSHYRRFRHHVVKPAA